MIAAACVQATVICTEQDPSGGIMSARKGPLFTPWLQPGIR